MIIFYTTSLKCKDASQVYNKGFSYIHPTYSQKNALEF